MCIAGYCFNVRVSDDEKQCFRSHTCVECGGDGSTTDLESAEIVIAATTNKSVNISG